MTAALVDTNWMADHLDDPNVRLIEITWEDLLDYEAGHIPGALGWHWKTALWDPLERQFPSDSDFRDRMEAAGIQSDTTVVFYGKPVQFGTYAWWVLKLMGHRDVRILDGGQVKWELEGRATTTNVPAIARTTYVNGRRNDAIRAGRDDVLSQLGDPRTAILDHRSNEEYSGERVCIPGKPDVGAERNGRIPGARHVPFETLFNADTTFKTRDEIGRILSQHVSNPAQPVISYCRLAHRATLAFFAMTELLDFEDVRVYDGSWTEWGSIVGVPIER